MIAPWTIRNYVHFHRFIPVNGQGEGMLVVEREARRDPRGAPGQPMCEEI